MDLAASAEVLSHDLSPSTTQQRPRSNTLPTVLESHSIDDISYTTASGALSATMVNRQYQSQQPLEPITESGVDCEAGASGAHENQANDIEMPKGGLSRRLMIRHPSLMLDGSRSMTKNGSVLTGTGTTGGGSFRSPFMRAPSPNNTFRASIREKSAGFLRHRLHASRRIRNRLVQKSGVCNIQLVNVPKQGLKYFNDMFTTIIEMKWRWCLLLFALSYVISWLFFALIFYTSSMSHGDFSHSTVNATDDSSTWEPCIANIRSDNQLNGFLGVLMFSVESQSTIGYGYRYPTEECPIVVITVCVQNMLGVMTQTLMAGVVFAKLARPKKRAETIMFSKNAVICMRDGILCMLFRLGDMRQSQLAEAHVRLQMIKKLVTREGELQPFHQYDMDVGYNVGLDRVFVIWPITICHVIDEESPLYEVSKEDLLSGAARFEIIAILEGIVESTGATTQARTSYLPSEVLWGHRLVWDVGNIQFCVPFRVYAFPFSGTRIFQKLVTYQRDNGEYRIDFGQFHATYPSQMPDLSAKQMDELRERGIDPERMYSDRNRSNFLGGGPISCVATTTCDEDDKLVNITIPVPSDMNNSTGGSDYNNSLDDITFPVPVLGAKPATEPDFRHPISHVDATDRRPSGVSVITVESVPEEGGTVQDTILTVPEIDDSRDHDPKRFYGKQTTVSGSRRENGTIDQEVGIKTDVTPLLTNKPLPIVVVDESPPLEPRAPIILRRSPDRVNQGETGVLRQRSTISDAEQRKDRRKVLKSHDIM